MTTARVVLIIACLFAVAGCANSLRAPVRPPGGLLFTNYQAPLTTNFSETSRGAKVGTGEAMYLRIPLIFVNPDLAWGDASIQTAARNGGITTVQYADYEYLTVLGIFSKVTVRVHGD